MESRSEKYLKKLIEATIIANTGSSQERGDEGEYNTNLPSGVYRRDIARVKDGEKEFEELKKVSKSKPNPRDISINGLKPEKINEDVQLSEKPAKGKKWKTNGVSHGDPNYRTAPGTDRGDSYCARSYGINKDHNIDCRKTPNKPNCLSRKKWNCSGKKSLKEDGQELEEATTVAGMGGWGAFGYDAPAFFAAEPKKKKKLTENVKFPLSGEYLYTNEGEVVTQKMINEWFDEVKGNQKPAYNGGKLVQIKSKCQTFPYCSQGAADDPIKLIGESKETMDEASWEYVSEIAEAAKTTPENIAKIIREIYLK